MASSVANSVGPVTALFCFCGGSGRINMVLHGMAVHPSESDASSPDNGLAPGGIFRHGQRYKHVY